MASELNSFECNALKTENGFIYSVQIDDFATTAWNYELGTSFTTDIFNMHFPDSVGDSSWVMQIYPNGQYNAEGYSNGNLSAYLKLISIENENKSLIVDITFKVIGIKGFQFRQTMNTNLKTANHSFNWNLKSTRWYGGSVVKLHDLYFFRSVQIECHLKGQLLMSSDIGKQAERISQTPATGALYNNSTDTLCRNILTPCLRENTDKVPSVEPPKKGSMTKSLDIEKPTECLPETPAPIVKFRSTDIRYRKIPTPNHQESTNTEPTVASRKNDKKRSVNVKETVKKIEEMTKEKKDTLNASCNKHKLEMAKNMEADNFQKVPRKRSEVSSDDSSGDDASVCLQPEAKRNSFLSGIADIINTMFDKKFASK